jgi:aldose sugar dehydrogenase
MNLSRPSSPFFWLAWHTLATIVILIAPSRLRVLRGDFDADIATLLVEIILTYWIAVIVLTVYNPKEGKIGLSKLTFGFLSILSGPFLFLLLRQQLYSRLVLVLSLVLVAVFIFLSLSIKTTLQKPALFVLSVLVLILLFERVDSMRSTELVVENKIITTSFYNLLARHHRNFGSQEVTGGAISNFGDRYLLATGDGQLYLLSWDPEKQKLARRKLSLRVPLNRDEFLRDTAQRKNVNSRYFRTADILVQDSGDDFRLFATHHYWKSEKQCFTVRVSAIYGSYSKFLASEESQTWKTVYESDPCLGFKNGIEPFAGFQIGGKLLLLDDHTLLLALGDHEFDGVNSEEILPQDETNHYGKTILINLDTHAASIYSIGHRNPQGLDIDASGTIWLTEHGPKGGDELNVILKGKNYGWPLVTYGTDYTRPIWPLNVKQGEHDGFEPPVYAWMPSIAVSAVISVQGGLFKIWKGDLLVGTLKDQSIWRVRVEKGRAVFTERIEMGGRIRDIMEDKNGRLILWTEQSLEGPTETAIVIVEPGPGAENNDQAIQGFTSVERGALLFAQCSGCHKLGNGNDHAIGPDLKSIFQGPIAAAKRYTYSAALTGLSGRWTEKNLDAYLANPQSFAPGTSMQFEGIRDPTERASLIEYLKSRR